MFSTALYYNTLYIYIPADTYYIYRRNTDLNQNTFAHIATCRLDFNFIREKYICGERYSPQHKYRR